jgi:hypothetical protein
MGGQLYLVTLGTLTTDWHWTNFALSFMVSAEQGAPSDMEPFCRNTRGRSRVSHSWGFPLSVSHKKSSINNYFSPPPTHLDEVPALLRVPRSQGAAVCQESSQLAVQEPEPAHQVSTEHRLELEEPAAFTACHWRPKTLRTMLYM